MFEPNATSKSQNTCRRSHCYHVWRKVFSEHDFCLNWVQATLQYGNGNKATCFTNTCMLVLNVLLTAFMFLNLGIIASNEAGLFANWRSLQILWRVCMQH